MALPSREYAVIGEVLKREVVTGGDVPLSVVDKVFLLFSFFLVFMFLK